MALDRRVFLTGILAAGAGSLAGCAGGASRESAKSTLLVNPDGTPNQTELLQPGPLGDRSLGKPDAPTTIIEYASLTCPYCRQFHAQVFPQVKKELIDTGKVRYIVREFPIGRTAGTAAIVTRCAPEKDYFELLHKYLAQQKAWVSQEVRPDAIYKVAPQTGMTRKAFDACLADTEIEEGLKTVKQRGREFGVVGTPTFFINGKKAQGVLTLDQIKAMIGSQVT